VGSSIARETTAGVYNHAGPEVAVASTKAFMSELVVFVLLAVFLGREKDMTEETGKEIVAALETLPDVLETMLGDTSTIEQVAKKYAHFKSGIYIGRGMNSAIAAEGSLKLKEVSYIHAEAYAGGELKHGPIALLDEQFPVIAIAPQDALYKKMVSNIEEIKARQAPVLALISAGDTELTQIVDDVIPVPQVHEAVQPIVHALVLHLLAYYIGVEKGLNVDRPRNLAKSVTVE
jgi:glucosamine--fructose-6-phosphate aminotransferase (isomerizing)